MSSRNRWTVLLFAPCAAVAIVCFGMSAWWGLVREHPKWDDYALVGVAWLLAAVGASVLFRIVAAVVSPERFLPRWLAVLMLVAIIIGALWMLLWLAMASAWGP